MTYNTEKRAAILSFLEKNRNSAYTVDEIAATLSPDGSGKSTYYRLISRLVEEGVVKRIGDEKTRHTTYQYLGCDGCGEHLHLKCKECGRLIHLDHTTSHALEERIMQAGGFSIDEGAILFGRCQGCKEGAR